LQGFQNQLPAKKEKRDGPFMIILDKDINK